MRAILLILLLASTLQSQMYFPPLSGSQWDTVSAASLGWCTSERDTLMDYLENSNTRSFIMLYRGRIVEEEYMNGFGRDSIWYWASAGKSLMAFLIGMAQEDGLLNINDKTSQYLDTGWTTAPRAKEDLITIWHQLTMTTGLDFNVPDPDCLEDTCLNYLHDAGTHWYYYNAPYRLLQDVLEVAAGQNLNLFTLQSLTNLTGINGLWFNYVFLSRARDMARFGLLSLNEGKWNGNQVLGDTTYFKDMVSPSQNLNEAYGYLWWLNGGSSFKQPAFDIQFPGEIIPSAPSDLYMAAGKNDQRIYVVPSLDLVVVRQGEAANNSLPALSGFDDELWELIMNYLCPPSVSFQPYPLNQLEVFPNPASDVIRCPGCSGTELKIVDSAGQIHIIEATPDGKINIEGLAPGVYYLWDPQVRGTARFIKP